VSLLEYDLDRPAEPASRPGWMGAEPDRVRARLFAFLLALALVSGLAGALVREAATQPPPPLVTPVSAWLVVRDVVLHPAPTVRLRLVVADLGTEAVEVSGLSLQGGGLSPDDRQLTRVVGAGGMAILDLESGLRCTGQPARDPAVSAVLQVRELSSAAFPGIRDVPVTSTGRLAMAGGACQDAARSLPDGWPSPIPGHASEVTVVDGNLDLVFELPGPDVHVVGVSADGTLLAPVATGSGGRSDRGLVHLRLQPPTPVCRAVADRPQVPAGLQVLVMSDPGGLGVRFIPAGPVLSHWLRETYRRACPDAAPSGVTL